MQNKNDKEILSFNSDIKLITERVKQKRCKREEEMESKVWTGGGGRR